MKKMAAGAAIVAAVGFSALTATPAMAVPFPNCSAAEAAGRFDIPVGDPAYGEHLDSDLDGIGCESGNVVSEPQPEVNNQPEVYNQPEQEVVTGTHESQVVGVPVGGAETGVAVEESSNAGGIAVAGGLGLAVAAGAAVVVRRRTAQA
ncbi:excalibur calcium-binding domain-containing protein [Kocuria sp. CPCC 205263]|uniref:excalibur calcium-binding domain-containing protein n=1 Tax=Kocuria sp. CPCC 205263 TaxID=3073555 RepID=UPI0034D3AB0F